VKKVQVSVLNVIFSQFAKIATNQSQKRETLHLELNIQWVSIWLFNWTQLLMCLILTGAPGAPSGPVAPCSPVAPYKRQAKGLYI